MKCWKKGNIPNKYAAWIPAFAGMTNERSGITILSKERRLLYNGIPAFAGMTGMNVLFLFVLNFNNYL
jgi:hypothetical protein